MAKSSIYLMDSTYKGHHEVYLEALKQIGFVRDMSKEFELTSNMKRVFSYVRDRRRIVNYALERTDNNDVLHLLYLDNLYTVSPFIFFPKNMKIIGTLHHFPNSKVKEQLLRILSKKLHAIIVHSEFIAKQLESINIQNFYVIDYPVLHSNPHQRDRDEIRKQAGIGKEHIVLSALGGTRFDKGLDILLDSLSFLEHRNKDKIILNIAGKEETYKKEFIHRKIEDSGIHVRVNLRLLTDEEFEENVQLSDAIILPYRKVFTGNSGPMTEGVYREKPIIGTDYGNLGYLIKQYKLGYTFESENSNSLAKVIGKFLNEGWSSSEESKMYQERLKLTYFKQRHVKLYKTLR